MPSKVLLIPLLAAIVAINPLAIDMYLPAMADIAAGFGSDITTVQQSLSLYLAGYAIGMLLFGPLADRFGRRPLVLLGLGGATVLSLAVSFAHSIELFLVLRFLQAFIGAAATVVVPGYIKQIYGEHTAKGMSYVSLIMMLAPLLAPSIGSLILGISHWQMIFWLLSLYAGAALLLVWRKLHLPVTLVRHDAKPGFLRSYATVLSRRGVKGYIGSGVLTSFAYFCYLTASPFVFMEVFGLDSHWFAIVFACNVGALMAANIVNTRIVGRFGSRRMLHAATVLGMFFGACLVLVNLLELDYQITVLVLMAFMACLGIMSVNADALVLLKFQHETGTATAVIGTLRFGCGAFAGPLLALFYTGTALPFALLMFASVLLAFVSQRLASQEH
ncbi:multidrug effflux MFS transporter [Shewanella cyperi]|uniref:multidrug effflux MFS transporter n=1 Tax=Shewanella cyperi TaxID=2814292 RepID=UPI001A9431C9|nr:multidrug effflux MFS transporter [Shewanella cyperi]QSX42589.1 multidrug effflux MFS transporter [Shewanella cyperi]